MLLLAIAGCTYRAGTFEGMTGTRQTIGCIDITVDKGTDQLAEGPVVSYGFGNRCRYPTTLDFTQVRVRGRTADGVERELIAFDPQHELRPLSLDAMFYGHENIEYVSAQPVFNVCVDIGGITGEQPHNESWVCQ
jgi:hypothetical protein